MFFVRISVPFEIIKKIFEVILVIGWNWAYSLQRIQGALLHT